MTLKLKNLGRIGLLSMGLLSPVVQAACNTEQYVSANSLITQAENENDQLQQSLMLMRALQLCSRYEWWMTLGGLHANQAFWDAAADAYSQARDYFSPDENGEMSLQDIEGQADANLELAHAHWRAGNQAHAMSALEESRAGYEVIDKAMPDRLLMLQGEIDDSVAGSDALILAETIALQRSRSLRGIGIRPKRQGFDTEASQVLADDGSADDASTHESRIQQADVSVGSSEQSARIADQRDPSAASLATQAPAARARINIQVLFDTNSDQLSVQGERSVTRISRAIDQLGLSDESRILVIGHTDSRGPEDYNMALSLRRADTIMLRLRESTETAARFTSSGKGESDLRFPGNTAEDHRRNRRVELIIAN